MAMGRPTTVQGEFWIPSGTMRQAPGHPFYERLNTVPDEAGFDRFCEAQCRKFSAQKLGRPSVVPGVYFRMLLIGYFEKRNHRAQLRGAL